MKLLPCKITLAALLPTLILAELLCGFSTQLTAQEVEIDLPLDLQDNGPITGARKPGAFSYVLDSQSRSLNQIRRLPDESWSRVSTKDINHGYTDSVLWVRIKLNTQTDGSSSIREIYLEEDFTLIRDLEATVILNDGEVFYRGRLSRTLPFDSRKIYFANPVLPLEIPGGSSTIYVKLTSDMDMIAALQIWKPENFRQDSEGRLLVFGILYGSVLLMSLYNGLIWLTLRDRTYLFYALYCLAFLFYFLSYYGHGAQFLWGPFPWFEQRAVPIVMAVQIGLFGSEFFRLFLSITRQQPYQYWSLRGIQIFSTGLLIASLTIHPSTVIVVYPLYAISGILIIAVISIIRYRQGFQPALFSIFAFMILWVSGIGSSLRSLGLVPYNDITMYGVAFGNVAELLLLSFGLGYRLRKLEDESENTGRRNQSLTGLLQSLPYAILLQQSGDVLFANRAARELYRHRDLPDWKDSGIHAFRQNERDRWISVHSADIEIESRSARLQFHSEITEEMESKLALEEKHASTIEAKARSEENRRAQDEFLESMTAEIRKPMSAVFQAADVLEQLSVNTDQRELAGILLRSANTLVSLLNDLEEVSRLEAGRLQIKAEPCEIDELLKDTIELFRTSAEKKSLELKLSVRDLPDTIALDATRLQQVMSNLISNAIKFSEPGIVCINALYIEGDPGQLRIEVEDNGPGIPEEKMDRLFKRFEQLDPGTYRRFGGTGLGLAISKGILEQMGGSIGCESLDSGGTRFWLELPAAILENEETADDPSTERPVQGLKAGLLLSPDDTAEILAHQLALLGIQVVRLDGTEPSQQRSQLDFMISESWHREAPWPSIIWNSTGHHLRDCPWPIIIPPCSTRRLAEHVRELMARQGNIRS